MKLVGEGHAAARMACAVLAALAALPAAAQTARDTGPAIFTCTSAAGRKLTSDRPIAECLDREQRVLNRDGSLRMMLPPSLTAEERAALEEAEKRKLQERANRQEAIRRDRNLLLRYPNEAAHRKAREAALGEVSDGIRTSEQRLAELDKERKPLLDEVEFYKGRNPPAKLKRELEANQVSAEAQRALIANQQAELGRVRALYDAELQRLERLWGGAVPGTLGPLPQSALAGASAPAAARQR